MFLERIGGIIIIIPSTEVRDDKFVFNRIVGLKDSWAKISKNS